MVSIILTILKIIGIILLAILGILLLLIALVLFVPVRYKASGGYTQGSADVSGKVRWFLGFVSLTVRYQSGQPFHIKTKVLFITIFDNLKKTKRQKKQRKQKHTSEEKPQLQAASDEEEYIDDERLSKTEEFCAGVSEEETPGTADEFEQEFEQDKKETIFQKIKAFFAKLVDLIRNIKFTFHKIYVIIVKIRDNIKYYWELLQQESTKQAFRLCSKQLSKIIKNISPKKYEVKLHLGFEDPSVMGNVLAVWGMLYPFHMGKVDIQPEFDQKVMEGSFRLKGRVSIYILLWTVWLFMTDKNIKQLRKQFDI